jgi:hypothetical protein
VNLAGITSFTFDRRPSEASDTIVADLFIGLAMLLGGLGHFLPSAILVAEFIYHSSLQHNPEFLWKSMLCLLQARRIQEALALAEAYIHSDPLKSAVFILPAMADGPPLADGERKALGAFHRRRIREARAARSKTATGAALYSMGMHFRSLRDYPKAVRNLDECAVADPSYMRRSYFWEDLGGACFMAKRYSRSAECYRRALRLLKDGNICRAKFADALLFAGNYQGARRAFRRYLRDVQHPDSEWILKERFTSGIWRHLKLSVQRRRTRLAVGLSGINPGEGPQHERMIRALRADALWGGAWFNLGVEAAGNRDYSLAFENFMYAAICQPRDTEACCQATLLGFFDRSQVALLPHIVRLAYNAIGEEYFTGMRRLLSRQPNGFPAEDVETFIRSLIDAIPPQRRVPVKVRLFPGGGDPIELTL